MAAASGVVYGLCMVGLLPVARARALRAAQAIPSVLQDASSINFHVPSRLSRRLVRGYHPRRRRPMLLGLATIIGGTNPRAVGSILLFCFFAISHVNHEIESGFIAKEQARLRSHIDIYENIINGTFLLSSPEQGEVVKFQYFSPRTIHHGHGGGPPRGRAHLDHFRCARLAQGVGWSVGC